MPSYYTYLISSLPMLIWGTKPRISFERFIKLCQGFIPDKELLILERISISGEYIQQDIGNVVLEKWQAFDQALRNELVNIRSSRKRLDPQKYLRAEEYIEPAITHLAMNAFRNPSILEGEMILDQARWSLLIELGVGHYFDLDTLIIYALKLLILERWERMRSADAGLLLEKTTKF